MNRRLPEDSRLGCPLNSLSGRTSAPNVREIQRALPRMTTHLRPLPRGLQRAPNRISFAATTVTHPPLCCPLFWLLTRLHPDWHNSGRQ
jgi:hypothetical protein